MATLTERLKNLRNTKKLTQKQVAEYFSLNIRTYSRYESGEIEPPISSISKLADYFEVSIDYLVGRSDNPGVEYLTRTKFVERLEALRIEKSISQKAVAEYLGIPERAYQLYEYDKREPSQDDLIKLADYFDVSTDYLLGRSDNPERH